MYVINLCAYLGHRILIAGLSCCLVGSLLDVPTHTVNMTTLKSTHDLWQSHSMSPYEVCAAQCILGMMHQQPIELDADDMYTCGVPD